MKPEIGIPAARMAGIVLACGFLSSCGGGGDQSSEQSPTVSVPDYVPPALRQEAVPALSPPSGATAVLFWGVAMHDTRSSDASQVVIDSQQLVCRIGATDRVVDINTYEASAPGGLCTKVPWCPVDLGALPVVIDPMLGVATFATSSRPDYVFRWWGNDGPEGRPAIPEGTNRCWTEARVRISGPALVQVGFDWYPTRTGAGGAIEGAVSNWLGASSDWQQISVGKPTP